MIFLETRRSVHQTAKFGLLPVVITLNKAKTLKLDSKWNIKDSMNSCMDSNKVHTEEGECR